MSRSNPHENGAPNPAVRWFEWNGETGTIRYYDKDLKQEIDIGTEFTFLLLDQLGSVRGWHDASNSGIYSNEVRDTRQEALIVKSFKGGTLSEGIYQQIKDRVAKLGGQFVANCYIAFKADDGVLKIGSLRVKGAALHAWSEFTKANRSQLYEKGIRIVGFTEGKKGRIVFRVPELKIVELSEQTNRDAVALDKELQKFLVAYFKRTKRDQVEEPPADSQDQGGYDGDDDEPSNELPAQVGRELTDDDIPF